MRQASEVWYTPAFNEGIATPGSYQRRQGALRVILARFLEGRAIGRVLDYGGDRGELVAGLLAGAQAQVYDISGMTPVAGVEAVADPRACQADLIVNSNVLEHVAFPQAFLRQILEAGTPAALVFLEVPLESPFSPGRLLRRIAQLGLMVLTRPFLARRVLRPSTLFMMHEHVNYFTEASLVALMTACHCQVLASGKHDFSGGEGKPNMAWCLGCVGQRDQLPRPGAPMAESPTTDTSITIYS